LPGTHKLLQQKSPPFAGQAPLTLQADETHWPEVGCDDAVLQIVLDPYTGSSWHCWSELQGPQVFVVEALHTRPASAPVHSALVSWQLPAWQVPWKQIYPAP
jgi:hypothetical protein